MPRRGAEFKPTITFQPIGITGDCGERNEIAFADVRAARTCDACGTDATLMLAQVAQLETTTDEARAEPTARYHAGETAITVERRSKLVGDQASTKIGVPPADGI